MTASTGWNVVMSEFEPIHSGRKMRVLEFTPGIPIRKIVVLKFAPAFSATRMGVTVSDRALSNRKRRVCWTGSSRRPRNIRERRERICRRSRPIIRATRSAWRIISTNPCWKIRPEATRTSRHRSPDHGVPMTTGVTSPLGNHLPPSLVRRARTQESPATSFPPAFLSSKTNPVSVAAR